MTEERQRILVIDDNADIRDLMAFVLQKENYEVTTAPDGVSGLTLIKENRLDLILLDVMMPEFSGFEVLEAIRTDKDSKVRAIPVLVITSKSSTADIDQALELGANSYIVKPFRPVNLVQKVNALLGNE